MILTLKSDLKVTLGAKPKKGALSQKSVFKATLETKYKSLLVPCCLGMLIFNPFLSSPQSQTIRL